MKISQTRILHLNLCVFLTALTHADSESTAQKIQHHVYKTVNVGDTVTLHCNTTLPNEDVTWKMNNGVVFSLDSFHKRNMTNFTSDRMCISPAAPSELKINQIQTSDAGNYTCYNNETPLRWILTVTENTPESLVQALLYILISCAGVIIVCLMIGFIICVHRRRKNNRDAGQRSPAPARSNIRFRSEVIDPKNYSIYVNVSK